MITFTSVIEKFAKKGEKTGWTYIKIHKEQAHQLNPTSKKSFRVKGSIDKYIFEGIALLPIGNGNFILPLNNTIRKAIQKRKGDSVTITIEIDAKAYEIDADFMACLQEEKNALEFYNSLPNSHRNYFSKWIESAKTLETKTKRIVQSLQALNHKMGYSEMIRSLKK